MIFSCFIQKLKEKGGGLFLGVGGGGGGAKGMLAPSQIIGGACPPPPSPPSSYAYEVVCNYRQLLSEDMAIAEN